MGGTLFAHKDAQAVVFKFLVLTVGVRLLIEFLRLTMQHRQLLRVCLIVLGVFLLGFPQDTIFAYLVVISVQSVLIHSNFKMNVGWLRYVIVTPQFHHWHHASDAEAIDKNYAAHTPLFDMLDGTWHLPKDRWPVNYGTVKPIPGGMLGQFMHPFVGPVKEFLEHRNP